MNPTTDGKTLNPFYSAKATPEALEKMQKVREAYKSLSDTLGEIMKNDPTAPVNEFVSVGQREFSLAKTNLEQSAMWAIKSISHYNVIE